jgi:hypothetical protein
VTRSHRLPVSAVTASMASAIDNVASDRSN